MLAAHPELDSPKNKYFVVEAPSWSSKPPFGRWRELNGVDLRQPPQDLALTIFAPVGGLAQILNTISPWLKNRKSFHNGDKYQIAVITESTKAALDIIEADTGKPKGESTSTNSKFTLDLLINLHHQFHKLLESLTTESQKALISSLGLGDYIETLLKLANVYYPQLGFSDPNPQANIESTTTFIGNNFMSSPGYLGGKGILSVTSELCKTLDRLAIGEKEKKEPNEKVFALQATAYQLFARFPKHDFSEPLKDGPLVIASSPEAFGENLDRIRLPMLAPTKWLQKCQKNRVAAFCFTAIDMDKKTGNSKFSYYASSIEADGVVRDFVVQALASLERKWERFNPPPALGYCGP
jgi:hypothetical protein